MIQVDDVTREMLLDSSTKKSFSVHFLNGEYRDLTSNDIVSESVKLTESICSGMEVQFGLCEASMIEFETIGVGNLKGAVFEAKIVLERDGVTKEIPYGVFKVDSHKRKAYYNQNRSLVAYSRENYLIETFRNEIKQPLSTICYGEKVNMYFAVKDMLLLCFPSVFNDGNNLDVKSSLTGFLEPEYEYDGKTYKIKYEYTINKYAISDYSTNSIIYNDTGRIVRKQFNYKSEYIEKMKTLRSKMPTEVIKKIDASTNTEYYIFVSVKGTTGYYEEQYITMDDSVLYPRNWVSGAITFSKQADASKYGTDNYWDSSMSANSSVMVLNKVSLYIDGQLEYTTGSFDNEVKVSEYVSDFYTKTDNTLFVMEGALRNVTSWAGTVSRYVCNSEKLVNMKPKELLEGYYELQGCFARISRNESVIEPHEMIETGNMYPGEDEYPDTDQYMTSSVREVYDKSMYIDVYYDDEESGEYESIYCDYTDPDGNSCSYLYRIISNQNTISQIDETNNVDMAKKNYIQYEVKNNFILANGQYSESQIESMLEPLAKALEGFSYTKFTLKAIGLPYIEPGDMIMVNTDDGAFYPYVMQRTITGIQNLIDEFQAN